MRLMSNRISDADEARRLELYGYGMSDHDIARRLDLDYTTVRQWRKRRGLPANCPTGGTMVRRSDEARRLALWRLRWSDARIARACGVATVTIGSWRRRRGLAAWHQFIAGSKAGRLLISEDQEERRMALYRRGLNDCAIGREEGVSSVSIHRWRVRRQLPPNKPERKWDRPATTMVSLDADLGEDGLNRHGLIADDAASAWLEENGSTRW